MDNLKIPSSSDKVTLPHNFEVRGHYAYFRKQEGVDPTYYQYLLSKAQREIAIWDPYFDLQAAKLFKNIKNDGVRIYILTRCDYEKSQDQEDVKAFAEKIKEVLAETGTSGWNVTVKGFKSSVVYYTRTGSKEFPWHDRFLRVDDSFFIVGASMKNQVETEKSFGIYEVLDKDEQYLIWDEYMHLNNIFHDGINGWKHS